MAPRRVRVVLLPEPEPVPLGVPACPRFAVSQVAELLAVPWGVSIHTAEARLRRGIEGTTRSLRRIRTCTELGNLRIPRTEVVRLLEETERIV